ncbi:hypothetical protein [Jiangella alba]|uniref:Uncharacterized protein n=1 Tax=Jiangella alba TaxID=561176 RepID=A0A1H5MQC3_9ACTN|nr:hypothetical protein [Jiangella alba]SEE90947.1 hypothetical protein SAMN04488561_3304 [Jiangella alba]
MKIENADIQHVGRPAIATLTRFSATGEGWHFDEELGGTFSQARRRSSRSRSSPVRSTEVPREVMDTARRLVQPGQRIRIVSEAAVVIENVNERRWSR